MMDKTLAAMAAEIEGALELSPDLAARTCEVLGGICGEEIDPGALDSTDRVLTILYKTKPGWTISAAGTVHLPNGHWSCTLRNSDTRDNDEYLGIGKGPTLPHSLLAALLKALAFERGAAG